jgi:signal transduction histidine kinase
MRYTLATGYLRAILLVSGALLVAMLAYNFAVVYPSFNRMLTRNTEEEATRVARYLMSEILRDRAELQLDDEAVARIRDAQTQFRLWKLKVFRESGDVAYSTNAAEIGSRNTSDLFKGPLPRGEIVSYVVKKHGKSSEGQTVPFSITETYVPILHGGRFLGAFEIYYDVTDRKAQLDRNLRSASLASFLIATLFFGALVFVLERAGRSIAARAAAEQEMRALQKQMIESEKMASLGALVAGVAHEINTPVGAAVTVASTLDERTRRCREAFDGDRMRRSELQGYLDTASLSASVILTSLRQAADLIRSFKQVAVDQSMHETRRFNCRQLIADVLLSMRPRLKQGQHDVTVSCPDDLELEQYPGALVQILTNLLMNSLTHAFEPGAPGRMHLHVEASAGQLRIRYSDDGAGMAPETLQRIYEPFFTTKRGQGGCGLGMHIVYNLVHQTLGGTIECRSAKGQGATFVIQAPLVGAAGAAA